MDPLDRIQRTLDHIEAHLREPELCAETAASLASLSPWHFQKVFRALVGDCFKEYVRKRRLSAALDDLRGGERRIIDLALDYGFESQESFTRAFKRQFGVTPGKARQDPSLRVTTRPRARITAEHLTHLNRGMTMEPTIVESKGMTLAGISARFISILSPDRTNHVVIPALWHRYIDQAGQVPAKKGGVDWGVCEALPAGVARSHPDELLYTAAAELEEEGGALPAGFELKEIPPGRWAVFIHKGSLERLGYTMDYIYGSWLPKSGHELRDGPDLERYDCRKFRPPAEDSELELWVPIR